MVFVIIRTFIREVISLYTTRTKGYSCSFINIGVDDGKDIIRPYKCIYYCLDYEVQNEDIVSVDKGWLHKSDTMGYRVDGFYAGRTKMIVTYGTEEGDRKTHVYFIRVWSTFMVWVMYILMGLYCAFALQVLCPLIMLYLRG